MLFEILKTLQRHKGKPLQKTTQKQEQIIKYLQENPNATRIQKLY